MASNNSSDGSSSSDSDNASPPSPPSPSSDDSDPPQSAPSKSPPPPSPPSPSPPHSPPPSPSQSPPPPFPSNSPPPSPSQSPPHSPSPSPPSPPPPSQSPPLAPSQSSPPPKSSPPSKSSPPPPSPSKPPPTPPSSSSPPPPPPPSTPPLPPSPPNGDSPPPSPAQQSPPPQSQAPPPPNDVSSAPTPPTSTAIPTPPAPASHVTPTPAPPTGSVPNHPPPPQLPHISPSSHRGTPSKSPSLPTSRGSGDNTGKIVGFTLGGVFILAFVSLVLFFLLRRTRKKKRGNLYAMPPTKFHHTKGGVDVHYFVEEPGVGNNSQDGFYSAQLTSPGNNYGNGNHAGAMDHLKSSSDPAAQPMGQIFFSYDKIVEITNGFSSQNVIGEGGFGRVYKASMPDGRVGAVKLLKAGGGQGEREFRAEVDIISRIHHRHLVSLIGYCISEQQRVLIYEFVPNGNLNQYMHGSGMPVLDWEKRMKIANGAARGLSYLHEGCNPKIIHRDIKSANILLDDAYEAQVADFGLARLTDDANTHVSTRVMGTFGYMAPEYATSGKLTDRSDVFSFGVVLLELITGRKPVDPTQPVGEESLVEWARPLLLRAIETGDFGELVDPRLEGQYVDSEMFRMIEAAAACVRHSAPKRPRMVQVANALDRGDQYDLSNGVKYGQSTVYDSSRYNEDIMRFRRMANGSFGDSDFDVYSTDYNSREMSGSKFALRPSSSSADSEFRAYHSLRNSAAEGRS